MNRNAVIPVGYFSMHIQINCCIEEGAGNMGEKKIAVITARGGSKRIPNKNKKKFCGKPIIEYSIQAARNAGIFDVVMVSTDDEEIARISQNAGAEVPFMRSEKNANDYAATADVIKEVLEGYEKLGQEFTYVCCIYPTAPFVTGDKLKRAMTELKETGKDCIMPVAAFSFPPLRGMVFEEGKLCYKWDEYALMRSQDLEEIYHDCGQFYAFRVDTFIKSGKIVTENTGGMIISELEMQDIDNEIDWKLAEMKYRLLTEC